MDKCKFKVGDLVFSKLKGWGRVEAVRITDIWAGTNYVDAGSIKVCFGKNVPHEAINLNSIYALSIDYYSPSGRRMTSDACPELLTETEAKKYLEAMAMFEKETTKKEKRVYHWLFKLTGDDKPYITEFKYATKEEVEDKLSLFYLGDTKLDFCKPIPETEEIVYE